jgi:putative pyruvate formate lyase activating enzyme
MCAIITEIRARGIRAPVIYNTSAYDSVGTLRELEGFIDIWLPDYKYADAALAEKLSGCADYPRRAAQALSEMYRQTGSTLECDDDGLACRGLIIRHLVLPGALENSKACLREIAENLSTRVTISLMAQYHPKNGLAPPFDRALSAEEYEEIVAYFFELGFQNGFVQELGSHAAFLPDFAKGEKAFEA